MKDEKVLLSIKDLVVKFRVRGRQLTAIRNVSLDIHEGESIAIVGESGSGKSVFTKTFAGMLDSNGYIDNGKIIFNDEELADTHVSLNGNAKSVIANACKKLDEASKHILGGGIDDKIHARNEILAKEIYLSVGRYGYTKRMSLVKKLVEAISAAMKEGRDIDNEEVRNEVFDQVAFRVRYLDETSESLHGVCILNLAKVQYAKDWSQIRGTKIATVFQDPMTSLNPIITIGKQITSIIIKHQKCSEVEARERAIELMHKVGIPNAEARFDDYPFQYSGGMRQRIVIAIALSCQPKILICDEPTTALDVTIQAQILKLIKDLQKEFKYTIVFITHDLGVVANIADRVAVMYAGQIVELGEVEEVFYDPRHPYTWALLSSLPQLAQRNTKLYSITGTPPSLYNEIKGDAFAPRNPYCMKIDTLEEPPMFKVTDTHYAKTWLLDPRAPKTEKPEIIQNIHEKLMEAFNI
jgi:oligopeptide transport system ATP-binding protein